jgi:hypothetical protein
MVPVGEVDRLIAENLTPALRAENMPDGCRSDAGVETERPKVGGIGEAPIEHSRPKEKDSTAPKSREAGSNSPSSAEPRALGLSLGMGLLRRRGRLALKKIRDPSEHFDSQGSLMGNEGISQPTFSANQKPRLLAGQGLRCCAQSSLINLRSGNRSHQRRNYRVHRALHSNTRKSTSSVLPYSARAQSA